MILSCILLCLVLMVYSFAGYPALMALMARLRPKPWQARVQSSAHEGLSVVLCVHNAATLIRPRLQNLQECTWDGPLDIVVVCDGCIDGTVLEIREFASSQVRVLERDQRGGKPAGLNLAIPQCHHQVVVLADARQSFDVDALQKLAAPFADPNVDAVSGLLEIASSEAGGGQGVDLYWQLETKLRAWEGQYDSVIGCTGAICAIRRDQYTPLPEDTLLDDVVIPMRLAVNGARIIYEPSARAFDPQKLEPGREKNRKLRTLVGNFQMMERYPDWLLPWRNRLMVARSLQPEPEQQDGGDESSAARLALAGLNWAPYGSELGLWVNRGSGDFNQERRTSNLIWNRLDWKDLLMTCVATWGVLQMWDYVIQKL